MFAVMNYLTLWRLFLLLYDKKKAADGFFWREENKRWYLQQTPAEMRERKEACQTVGTNLKTAFPQDTISTLIAPKNLNYHQHTFAQTN